MVYNNYIFISIILIILILLKQIKPTQIKPKQKILFITNSKFFEDYILEFFSDLITLIKSNNKIYLLDLNKDKDINIKNFDILILDIWAQYHTMSYNKDKKYKNKIKKRLKKYMKIKKKIVIIEDMYEHSFSIGLTNYFKYLNKNFQGIILKYGGSDNRVYLKMLKECPNVKIKIIPHHINTKKFNDYNIKKKYDIFFYGYDFINFYPFRNRIKKLLEKNNNKFKIKILEHPGHNSKNKNKKIIIGSNLSKMINSSWLTISTPSIENNLFSKYFEISASKSVILGQMPEYGKKIWKNNYIEITNNMTDYEIIKVIKKALKNKDKLKNIIEEQYHIIQKYNIENYLKKIIYYIYFNILYE